MADAFTACVTSAAPPPDLEERLSAAWRLAQREWPGVDVPPLLFVRHLARHAAAAESDPYGELESLHASDLYLACGCVEGNRSAHAVLDARFLRPIAAVVSRSDPETPAAQELVQALRDRLLAPADEGARIGKYGGRGPLSSWIRIAAIRLYQSGQGRPSSDIYALEESALAAPDADPEMQALRTRCHAVFRESIEAAVASLSTRERNILRLHLLDGMSARAIAALYEVHEATMGRWLVQYRDAIVVATRTGMAERLGVETARIDSLFVEFRSALDVTMSRLLR